MQMPTKYRLKSMSGKSKVVIKIKINIYTKKEKLVKSLSFLILLNGIHFPVNSSYCSRHLLITKKLATLAKV